MLVSCNLLVYVMEWTLCYGVEFMLGSGTKVMEYNLCYSVDMMLRSGTYVRVSCESDMSPNLQGIV